MNFRTVLLGWLLPLVAIYCFGFEEFGWRYWAIVDLGAMYYFIGLLHGAQTERN